MFRPLVDAAGQREVRRRLGEHERHHELAEDDDRPRPEDPGGAARVEAVVEEREEAVRRRHEAEGDGERTEEAERPVELLLVAELGEELLVLLVLGILLGVEHTVMMFLVSQLRPPGHDAAHLTIDRTGVFPAPPFVRCGRSLAAAASLRGPPVDVASSYRDTGAAQDQRSEGEMRVFA